MPRLRPSRRTLRKLFKEIPATRKADRARDAEGDDKAADETKPAGIANPLGLFDQVKDAVDRYRTTVTWIVTTYAAVWAALVGTVPFAGLGDLSDGTTRWAAAGLILAGIGASFGIYAASRVLEPEDASLGELTMRAPHSTGPRLWRHPVQWIVWHLRGKVEARSDEQMWHLFDSESGSYFDSPEKKGPAAAHELIERINRQRRCVRDHRNRCEAEADGEKRAAAARQAAAAQVLYDDALERRAATLAIAVTYQVRAKYLSSRRLLLIGAGLVLLGTVLYLTQVAADADAEQTSASAPESLTPVIVRLQPDTWASLEITAGGAACLGDVERRGAKLAVPGFVHGSASAAGPWNVLLPPGDAAGCRAVEFELDHPDGRVVAR